MEDKVQDTRRVLAQKYDNISKSQSNILENQTDFRSLLRKKFDEELSETTASMLMIVEKTNSNELLIENLQIQIEKLLANQEKLQQQLVSQNDIIKSLLIDHLVSP